MIKVAVIGLDTSHSIEFPRRMQAPDCPKDQRVSGLRAVSCLRFKTPFQDDAGLDKRQAQLEAWGVKVTTDFDEAVEKCDAIMLEINDGSFHLPYFKKVANLGKPVFLDKPLASSLADGRAIVRLAAKHRTLVWSGSSLPFAPELKNAVARVSEVRLGHAFGPLGAAPVGDSLIWYGVHSFEMLLRIMGPGPKTAHAAETSAGITTVIDYGNGRQGVVEAITGAWSYGGRVQGMADGKPAVLPFICECKYLYRDILKEIKRFFEGGRPPVSMETTLEGLAMMAAARKSLESGKPAKCRG